MGAILKEERRHFGHIAGFKNLIIFKYCPSCLKKITKPWNQITQLSLYKQSWKTYAIFWWSASTSVFFRWLTYFIYSIIFGQNMYQIKCLHQLLKDFYIYRLNPLDFYNNLRESSLDYIYNASWMNSFTINSFNAMFHSSGKSHIVYFEYLVYVNTKFTM